MDPVNLVVCGDDSFGPVVKSADCRGGFDFTSEGPLSHPKIVQSVGPR